MFCIIISLFAFSISSDPEPSGPLFCLVMNGKALPEHRYAVVVQPGEQIEFYLSEIEDTVLWKTDAGEPRESENRNFIWTAPRSHGVTHLTVEYNNKTEIYSLLLPVDGRRWRTTSLNSFPIGSYGSGNRRSEIPEYFFELTSGNSGTRLSTHQTLSDYLCHIEGNYPQYIALDLDIVDKIEIALAMVSQEYLEPVNVVFISGFRTPEYNLAIGNITEESLHLYGAAADIWFEAFPSNNLIDDLDRNKRIDVQDGEYIVNVFRRAEALGLTAVGGVSAYRWNMSHGPFVHVDTRGSFATWTTQRNLVSDPVI